MNILKNVAIFILTAGLLSQFAHSDTREKLMFIDKYDSNGDYAVAERERVLLDASNFDFFDKNNDQKISKGEYLSLRDSLNASQIHNEYNRQIKQTVIRFSSLDDDSNKKITFDEFSLSSNRIFTSLDIDENNMINEMDKDLISKKNGHNYKPEKMDDRDEESMKRFARRVSSAKYLLRMPSTHSLDGFLIKYDKGNSKAVSLDSFSKQRRNVFDAIDTDKNGWVSDVEYITEYQSRLVTRVNIVKDEINVEREKQFSAYDSNTNNSISRSEYNHLHQNVFIQLDTDKDGFVSLDDEPKAITLTAK